MQQLVGYLDTLHARPGDTVALRVSSAAAFTARLVRLAHEVEVPVPTSLDGRRFDAHEQPIERGSHLAAEGVALPAGSTVTAWVFRTGAAGTLFEAPGAVVPVDAPLRRWTRVGAALPATDAGPWRLGRGFDGKLARPELTEPDGTTIAAWDLSAGQHSTRVPDTGPHGRHARLHGMPTRAVTGPDWTGDEDAWRHAPAQWDAVHLHTDDLEDAGWDACAELELPAGLPSALYAVRLDGEDGSTDHVPLAVTPREPGARVAVLLPTFTYRAYADEAISPDFDVVARGPADERVLHDGLLSQYNVHADGSGVVHASTRRPQLGTRPHDRYWLTGFPHGLAADLHLLGWLEHAGIAYDVLTDEVLHERGVDAVAPYAVVVTGSHPEYVTREELQALHAYEGRLMALGGNGFQLVVGVHAERPWVTEVRRGEAHVGLWQGQPGELHLASTGAPGGHWALRKERSRALTGLDLSGMGFADARPYERTARSRERDVAWVFDGVPDGPIGTDGLVMGGAAGYEVDAFDPVHGSPPDGVVLATATGFGAGYELGGTTARVRADLVLLGDRVFATGSIAWCGALPVNDYDNAVAAITGNVLRRFAAGP